MTFFAMGGEIAPAESVRSRTGALVFPNHRGLAFAEAERPQASWRGGRLGASGVELWTVRSTGHAVDLAGASRCSYHLTLRGDLAVAFGSARSWRGVGRGALLGVRERRTRVSAAGDGPYESCVVLMPEERLAAISPDGGFAGGARGLLHEADDHALRAYVSFLFPALSAPDSALMRSPAALGHAAALLTELYLDAAWAGARRDAFLADAGARQAERAESIMRERFATPLTIPEIAREIGVGVRALQLAFRRRYDAGPREVLNRIRLEECRMRLLRGDPAESVTAAAHACGFTHLGRFSVAYGRTFGEPPSATRAAALRRLRSRSE